MPGRDVKLVVQKAKTPYIKIYKRLFASVREFKLAAILAPIFIFVLNWGIGGAALATICGQAISLVWHIIHFREKSSFVHFDKNHNKFSWSIIKNVYSLLGYLHF